MGHPQELQSLKLKNTVVKKTKIWSQWMLEWIWERELLSPQIEISLLVEKLSTPDKSDSSYVPYLLNFYPSYLILPTFILWAEKSSIKQQISRESTRFSPHVTIQLFFLWWNSLLGISCSGWPRTDKAFLECTVICKSAHAPTSGCYLNYNFLGMLIGKGIGWPINWKVTLKNHDHFKTRLEESI